MAILEFRAMRDSPSETPSISPTQNAVTPIIARKAGMTVVAISWDPSLNNDASPMPSTVRFSQLPECGRLALTLPRKYCRHAWQLIGGS